MPDIGPLSPNATIKVSPVQLQGVAGTSQESSYIATEMSTAALTALNDLASAMGAVDFCVKFAGTLGTFGAGLMATLACYSTGLSVASENLAVAASAFQGLDASLAHSFTMLESQISPYTGYEMAYTMPTIQASSVSLGTSGLSTSTVTYQLALPPSSSGGSFFSHVWHDVNNWGSDVYHSTTSGLESIGVPGWMAIGIGGVAIGGYYALASVGAVAAAG